MPDINQYVVSPRDLVEMIIKASGIHEGRWALLVNYGIIAGNFGPTPESATPGVVVAVQNIGIQREAPGAPNIGPPVLDAATVNPDPSRAPPSKRAKAPKAKSST
jgi:hypothetical protein